MCLEQRQMIVEVIKAYKNTLHTFDEVEIIFALMPFKHLKQYDFIFDYLHNTWLSDGKKIIDYPDLQKFYIDTYKKAFTLDIVKANLITDTRSSEPYDASLICDYYPERSIHS